MGWQWLIEDPGVETSPFSGKPGLTAPPSDPNPKPEVFFNMLFDDSMWDRLTMYTNIYASENTDNGKYI